MILKDPKELLVSAARTQQGLSGPEAREASHELLQQTVLRDVSDMTKTSVVPSW